MALLFLSIQIRKELIKMAQAKMYQVDHLKQNIYNVFSESISVLEQQRRIEEREFIQEKRKFIAKKLGADKIKQQLENAKLMYEKAQQDAKDFCRKYAGKHNLGDTHYRMRNSETISAIDIDNQVDEFASKYAHTFMKKSKASKDLEQIKALKDKLIDNIVLTNDIEEAEKKVISVLQQKAPFILEQYSPDLPQLEKPQEIENQI